MSCPNNPITPKNIKRSCKTVFTTSVLLVFTSMSAMAFEGSTQGECYDYVVDGCNTKPECTAEELGFLLDGCDAYPQKVKTPRPAFTAKQPSSAVVKSSAYKKKIKKLRADIRRK